MVHLRGSIRSPNTQARKFRLSPRFYDEKTIPIPKNPSELLTPQQLEDNVSTLIKWFQQFQHSPSTFNAHNTSAATINATKTPKKHKSNVLCITGAGLSTESGIPDYRGHNGSYQKGHQPMIHDEFMRSGEARKRYWGRSLAGSAFFYSRKPNLGHYALTKLESMGKIGVEFDMPNISANNATNAIHKTKNMSLSIITQNVDSLHDYAGTQNVMELHGRGNRLICMHCGSFHCRNEFHNELKFYNQKWFHDNIKMNDDIRPDGDANLPSNTDYSSIHVPACSDCEVGFLKPHVVFFGDNVPKHDVDLCYAAVDAADGLLCIGTSLEVHSAYRFVKATAKKNIPIGILNVGETRAERESHLFSIESDDMGLDADTKNIQSLLTKIESPVGKTLEMCVERMLEMEDGQNNMEINISQ